MDCRIDSAFETRGIPGQSTANDHVVLGISLGRRILAGAPNDADGSIGVAVGSTDSP